MSSLKVDGGGGKVRRSNPVIIVNRDNTFVNARGYDGNNIILKLYKPDQLINLGVFAIEMTMYNMIETNKITSFLLDNRHYK